MEFLQRSGAASSDQRSITVECEHQLERGGIAAALAWLNARTRFRFSGIYRVEPPLLLNVALFDRENPALNVSGGTSTLEETYCAMASRAPFGTGNSRDDVRLTAHASRDSIISYAGVPLRLASGCTWGTLCHYDLRPRLLSPSETAILESVAPLFVRALVPGSAAFLA